MVELEVVVLMTMMKLVVEVVVEHLLIKYPLLLLQENH